METETDLEKEADTEDSASGDERGKEEKEKAKPVERIKGGKMCFISVS